MEVTTAGKYLGITVGPGKGHTSWRHALTKAAGRVADWQWSSLGLSFATQAWNTFIASVLGFVAQVEGPPPEIDCFACKLLRTTARGPG